MRKIGLGLFGLGLLGIATPAIAQEQSLSPSLRVETGVALDFNQPQSKHYDLGFGGLANLAFNLTPWLDVGPTIGTVQLAPNNNSYPSSGVSGAWEFGGGLRLKRPHNYTSSSKFSGSPWVDTDLLYVNTGGLNRFAYSVGVGISGDVDYNRNVWFGPFVRYTQVVDGTQFGGNASLDHTDASLLTFGIELEWEPGTTHKTTTQQKPSFENLKPKMPLKEPAVMVPTQTTETLHVVSVLKSQTVAHFYYDSDTLGDEDKAALAELADTIVNDISNKYFVKIDTVEVDGYSSFEGTVAAEKHNKVLSEKRAQAVADYLEMCGVPHEILSVKGLGYSNPIEENDTQYGRQANRRVEVQITVEYNKLITTTTKQ